MLVFINFFYLHPSDLFCLSPKFSVTFATAMRKPLFYVIIGILIVGLLAASKYFSRATLSVSAPSALPGPMAVQGIRVKPQLINRPLAVPGTVIAGETVVLYPEIQAKLKQVLFQEGSRVNAGDLLFKLEDDELQAGLRKLEAQLLSARKKANRLQSLLAADGVSQQEYDDAMTRISELEADAEVLKAAIRKTEIRAPFSGKAGLRLQSPGARVNTTSALSTIMQTGTMKLDVEIPEYAAASVEIGTRLAFMTEGTADTLYARVYATEPGLETGSRNLRIRAEVQGGEKVYPGSFATVFVNASSSAPAILLPGNCFVPQGRKQRVLVSENGIAAYREVITGTRFPGKLSVLSGLNEGDTVISSGMMFLKPGTPVHFKSVVAQ